MDTTSTSNQDSCPTTWSDVAHTAGAIIALLHSPDTSVGFVMADAARRTAEAFPAGRRTHESDTLVLDVTAGARRTQSLRVGLRHLDVRGTNAASLRLDAARQDGAA